MIDRARIEELRAELGEDDLSFIVSVYLDEARATLQQLRAGLARQEHLRAIHFLRSGALNIGLRGIAVLAGQMEVDLTEDRGMTHTLCASQLEAALDRTMDELGAAMG